MAIKVLMPALSPTMSEGNLTKWMVKVGDQVKAGDILAEIETDKATMEVEAVDEGKITKLLIEEGQASVKVNTPIAILNDEKNDTHKEKLNESVDKKIESNLKDSEEEIKKDVISNIESNKNLKSHEIKLDTPN